MLRLTGVCKRVGTRHVCANVGLTLDAGEYDTIIGESGVGKSTLLKVIAGLEPVVPSVPGTASVRVWQVTSR